MRPYHDIMDLRTALQRLLSGIGGGARVVAAGQIGLLGRRPAILEGMMPGTPRLRLRRTRLRLNRRPPDAHICGYASVPRHDGHPDAHICGYASVTRHDGPPDCPASATVGQRQGGTGRRGATKRPVNRLCAGSDMPHTLSRGCDCTFTGPGGKCLYRLPIFR